MNGNSLHELARAVRGPIMLITLGTLFAIDQNGAYSFSRTWPVLIIVLGLLKLAEMLAARMPSPGGIQP